MVAVMKSVYKCLEVAKGSNTIRLVVGDSINFATEDGVLKSGVIEDFGRGKEEKTEIIIIPTGEKHKETWCVIDMAEDSLTVVDDDEEV